MTTEDMLSWSILRQMNAMSRAIDARRLTVGWIIDRLETHLGEHWPEDVASRHISVQRPLVLLTSHTFAFATWLDLALQLEAFKGASGFGSSAAPLATPRSEYGCIPL
jgi:hypothetical protein